MLFSSVPCGTKARTQPGTVLGRWWACNSASPLASAVQSLLFLLSVMLSVPPLYIHTYTRARFDHHFPGKPSLVLCRPQQLYTAPPTPSLYQDCNELVLFSFLPCWSA